MDDSSGLPSDVLSLGESLLEMMGEPAPER
jgi:hypothetical protein